MYEVGFDSIFSFSMVVTSIFLFFRLIGKSPMIDVDFTWYCNFLTISYSTILLSACSNPVIYFYFAYKQVTNRFFSNLCIGHSNHF